MVNMVGMEAVLKEPDIYPDELVASIRRLEQDESLELSIDEQYSIRGYIIHRWIVGIHPKAPDSAKKEWMEHWQKEKDNPDINW